MLSHEEIEKIREEREVMETWRSLLAPRSRRYAGGVRRLRDHA